MGEVAIPCLDWFVEGDVKLWDDNLPVSRHQDSHSQQRHEVLAFR